MHLTFSTTLFKKTWTLLAFGLLTQASFAQKADSLPVIRHFSGSISANNNGISIVPSFSLGKPAAIFMLSMGKKRWSFDPDLRFSLAGKPWSFLFWGRYKVIPKGRFKLTAGTHLGLNYKTSVLPINGDTSETTIERRYLAGELFPRYQLTKHLNIGIYYLYSHGLDAGTIGNTHFLTLNTIITNLKLTKKIYLNINPQCYYLKLDTHAGFYFTSSVTLTKRNFPLAISAIVNQRLSGDIAGDEFVWNVGLIYAFHKEYLVRR